MKLIHIMGASLLPLFLLVSVVPATPPGMERKQARSLSGVLSSPQRGRERQQERGEKRGKEGGERGKREGKEGEGEFPVGQGSSPSPTAWDNEDTKSVDHEQNPAFSEQATKLKWPERRGISSRSTGDGDASSVALEKRADPQAASPNLRRAGGVHLAQLTEERPDRFQLPPPLSQPFPHYYLGISDGIREDFENVHDTDFYDGVEMARDVYPERLEGYEKYPTTVEALVRFYGVVVERMEGTCKDPPREAARRCEKVPEGEKEEWFAFPDFGGLVQRGDFDLEGYRGDLEVIKK
ncbi:hypothetical protein EX30DRAFT_350612 [Ascodesmis nigricans]|uniref:Uncharacterized protein n=1 Tax=Ascodesmis nigricans TaxID=341454 RepID=A0A4S2MNY5_9PEZI|nr:hypothetical protein EX30DRAFT_350612 [Ascodesmis nigricans]